MTIGYGNSRRRGERRAMTTSRRIASTLAAAEWDIRREVDPMTDDVTISHALKGERSMTYHFVCGQKDGKVQQYSAGFRVPGAAFRDPEIAARMRYDGATEPLVGTRASRMLSHRG
ncbi:hypothetical protein [Azospirillum cavernae]|uniref:hypothetical protein n=1 Tax=Azospirillum cavernae TaxID=2320860 RepID=UPI0011C3EB53|nr:hypothetical protein [Azospirillum cavernae]